MFDTVVLRFGALQEVPPELELVARSQRVSRRRLRDATGWEPRVRAGTGGRRLLTAAARPQAA